MAAKQGPRESDAFYVLKIILYLVLGSQWLRIQTRSGTQIAIPYGGLLGLLLAMHERFGLDRKIEYALLLVAMFVGFWLPIGLTITFH